MRHDVPDAKKPAAGRDTAGRDTAGRDTVVDAFIDRFGRRPEVVIRAPGRVSLLGAHIDYSEGRVITAAIDRAVWLAASPAEGSVMRIHALDLDRTATLDLARLPPPPARRSEAAGQTRAMPEHGATWIDYPAGVAWALGEAGKRVRAMHVAFGGNLPIGAGVSSSAAVEMAFLLAWEALRPPGDASFAADGAARARLGMRAENGYLGVSSGIMDQFSSLHGAAGKLILLDCRSLDFEHLPLPASTSVLVADSGVRRRLADLDYNDRRQECTRAVETLSRWLPGISTLRDVSLSDFELYSHRLPMTLRRRARHAIEECRRVREGAAALRAGDLAAFGRLMRRSQLSSRDLYEVSIPEIDLLAAAAWATPGCHGARLVGGGFGGCVVALAETSAAEAVRRAMTLAFTEELERRPEIFVCAIDDGAGVLT